MTQTSQPDIKQIIEERYGASISTVEHTAEHKLLLSMLSRGSCREFSDKPVPPELLEILCAAALASPTKSDLQQRDIILLQSADLRQQVSQLVSGQPWVAGAPMIVIFCGNNRRQRLLHHWHDVPFANDHLDAFFNAVGDAAIALGAFVTATEALGLGCCPVSAIRNEARAVSSLLGLPRHVFPFAGLAVGYPRIAPKIAKRLPLRVTCHVDQYEENNLRDAIETYDDDRIRAQPYAKQRFPDKFGTASVYGWSDDKVRQYSEAERADFADYIRAQGFRLD
ncbi:MAG: nitroreductase family protein [Roseobacter sp.]|jgi:nitroreductase/FMN reductase [NAD(P)H]